MSSHEFNLPGARILVIGAGIMGAGIAQVAALAGHAVALFDAREGLASQARSKLASTLNTLVAKGRIDAADAAMAIERIEPVTALEQVGEIGLVIEAVLENLDVKRALFKQLEMLVAPQCVLASNTSSLSITALANGLAHPERVVGMHFFNPVPLMKLVEVVSGLRTSPRVAEAVFALANTWDKVAVHTRSTPGFIVNRIARPYYAESLAMLQERAAEPHILDACLRSAGFRMGPCELMDLIGHDTNFAVTTSVYEANFFDKRFVPSLVQRELVDAGLLGRKVGRGFYDYAEEGSKPQISAFSPSDAPPASALRVVGSGGVADQMCEALSKAGCRFSRDTAAHWVGLEADGAQLRLTDGRPATAIGDEVAVFDLPLAFKTGATLAWAPSARATDAWCMTASRWLRVLGFNPQRLTDSPGLVVARTVAMLINEAADAVHQGVCSASGADAAMKLGVNYPAGPFEWLASWSPAGVLAVLDALDTHYRGERYRASPWLRQRAWCEAPS